MVITLNCGTRSLEYLELIPWLLLLSVGHRELMFYEVLQSLYEVLFIKVNMDIQGHPERGLCLTLNILTLVGKTKMQKRKNMQKHHPKPHPTTGN